MWLFWDFTLKAPLLQLPLIDGIIFATEADKTNLLQGRFISDAILYRLDGDGSRTRKVHIQLVIGDQ